MVLALTSDLQEYVAHCPSCGKRLSFRTACRVSLMEAVDASCLCGRKWAIIFDLDESGTFGVQSFQCDNEDRILPTNQ